jgi:heme exporter protein D
MKWHGVQDFLAMGGYALYVWGAYGVAVVVVALEIVLLRARTRTARRLAGTPRPGDEAD